MSLFHVTLSQGRGDTLYLESPSKTKLLDFLKSVSTAVIRNIKQVVYSKTYNINFTHSAPYVQGLTYHKVIIFAYSKNYSQQFVLYNVKRTITKEQLEIQYKKLFILTEPIEGFFNIQFYDEVAKSENIDFLYQVQYKRNSKTYTEDFYSPDYQKVKDFFETVIDGELIEIRKYVHLDTTIKKDDFDYIKRISFYISNESSYFSSFIPKVKKTLDLQTLKSLIEINLTFKDKRIDTDSIKLTLR